MTECPACHKKIEAMLVKKTQTNVYLFQKEKSEMKIVSREGSTTYGCPECKVRLFDDKHITQAHAYLDGTLEYLTGYRGKQEGWEYL